MHEWHQKCLGKPGYQHQPPADTGERSSLSLWWMKMLAQQKPWRVVYHSKVTIKIQVNHLLDNGATFLKKHWYFVVGGMTR